MFRNFRRLSRFRLLPALALLAAGMLLVPQPAVALPDPLEPFNRLMHALNNGFKSAKAPSEPAPAESPRPPSPFEAMVVEPVYEGLRGLFANLREPVTVISSLLVADTDNARVAAERFVLNTTLGFGGLRDVARLEHGLESRPRDLGQVVCAYELPEGPYLVLPLLGPTTLPEIGGRVLTIVAGYQLLGRPYFRYRAADRVNRMANPPAASPAEVSSMPEDDAYLAAKRSYERSHDEGCRLPAPPAPPQEEPPAALQMVEHPIPPDHRLPASLP